MKLASSLLALGLICVVNGAHADNCKGVEPIQREHFRKRLTDFPFIKREHYDELIDAAARRSCENDRNVGSNLYEYAFYAQNSTYGIKKVFEFRTNQVAVGSIDMVDSMNKAGDKTGAADIVIKALVSDEYAPDQKHLEAVARAAAKRNKKHPQ